MTMQCAAGCVAVGALLFSAGCAPAPTAEMAAEEAFTSEARRELCPSSADAVPFDPGDSLESQLAAIGCHAKTRISEHEGPWVRFVAFCPDGTANDALVALYRQTHPYHLRAVSRCNDPLDGTVVDEWDPFGGGPNRG